MLRYVVVNVAGGAEVCAGVQIEGSKDRGSCCTGPFNHCVGESVDEETNSSRPKQDWWRDEDAILKLTDKINRKVCVPVSHHSLSFDPLILHWFKRTNWKLVAPGCLSYDPTPDIHV